MHTGHQTVICCLHCVRPWRHPPHLLFAFRTHIRQHLDRYPGHQIAYWCRGCDCIAERWLPNPPVYEQPALFVLPERSTEHDARGAP